MRLYHIPVLPVMRLSLGYDFVSLITLLLFYSFCYCQGASWYWENCYLSYSCLSSSSQIHVY